jgi:hypothetical protein
MAGRLAGRVRADNRAAIARIAARLDGVSESALQKQAARAMVSVRRKAQPVAKRIVRQMYGVQAGAIGDAFDAVSGTDGGQAFVALRARVAPVSLIRFGGRWSKRGAGATAEIMRGERKTYESAFISVMPNGGRHIFARAPQGSGKRAPRLPLRRLHGPSAYQMVQGKRGETAEQVNAELSAYAADETLRLIAAARKGR